MDSVHGIYAWPRDGGGRRKGGLWFGAVVCSGTMTVELICESGGRR